MRHIYSVQKILQLTGLQWKHLVPFIPYPLKPEGWDNWTENERNKAMVKRRLNFGLMAVEEMIRQICMEYVRQQDIRSLLEDIQWQQHESNVLLVDMYGMLREHKEYLTLRELAEKLHLGYGTLRNKIKNRRQNGVVWYGDLEARGLKLKLWKDERGQWFCDSLQLRNQWRQLSMRAALKMYEDRQKIREQDSEQKMTRNDTHN